MSPDFDQLCQTQQNVLHAQQVTRQNVMEKRLMHSKMNSQTNPDGGGDAFVPKRGPGPKCIVDDILEKSGPSATSSRKNVIDIRMLFPAFALEP